MSVQTAQSLPVVLGFQETNRRLNGYGGSFPMYVPLAEYLAGNFAAATLSPPSWVVPGFGSHFALTYAGIAFETAGEIGSGNTVATIRIREANAEESDPILAEMTLTAAERCALTVDSLDPVGHAVIPLTTAGKSRNIAGRRLYVQTTIAAGTAPTSEPEGTYFTLSIQPPTPQLVEQKQQ